MGRNVLFGGVYPQVGEILWITVDEGHVVVGELF